MVGKQQDEIQEIANKIANERCKCKYNELSDDMKDKVYGVAMAEWVNKQGG